MTELGIAQAPIHLLSGRDRILLFSQVDWSTGCWEWQRATTTAGYGSLVLDGVGVLAHRVSYEAFKGEIPGELTVDHLCCNKRCVNPEHLEAVTRGENTRRWALAKTHRKHGHEFTHQNTHVVRRSDGREERTCKTCRRLSERRRRSAA